MYILKMGNAATKNTIYLKYISVYSGSAFRDRDLLLKLDQSKRNEACQGILDLLEWTIKREREIGYIWVINFGWIYWMCNIKNQ